MEAPKPSTLSLVRDKHFEAFVWPLEFASCSSPDTDCGATLLQQRLGKEALRRE